LFKIYDGRSQFYQWDIDRKLIVEDATINEVHFCNRTDECSLICEVYDLDGLRVADVPNILLQDNWRINVYAYDTNYTKHSEVFEVVKRSKPADYIYTETEIKNYDDLAARVDEIEKNGISDEAVEQAVEKYLEENDIKVDLTGYATETYVNEAVAAIELTPGPAGPAGKDGEDYVLTEADKKEIAGMVEVTGGGDVDLTGYATEKYVDDAISEIELTPGPAGADGKDGYTPVKGVDYFDGQDGKDGVDGKTPVKGVDYFDGQDGAPGKDGVDGKDYVLTDADKAEIAGMIDIGDVDLTDYYTKEEIDELLANLPSGGGDLPAAEGVEF
jgi:hypothetical protein